MERGRRAASRRSATALQVWAGAANACSFYNFQVRDIAGPFEVDGRWFCDRGNVRVDNADNNVLEAYGTDGVEDCIIRRGFRGDKYVATFKFKWNNNISPGWVVRWLSPGDYVAIAVSKSDGKARCYKRENDAPLTALASSSTALSLTTNTWYEAKVVIDNDPNDANLQQLGWDGHPARQRVDADRLTGGTPVPPGLQRRDHAAYLDRGG